MKIASREGWIPPRTTAVRSASVCLAAAVAIFVSAQVCLAAGDFPLKAMRKTPVFTKKPGAYGVAVSGPWTLSAGPTATITLKLAGVPVGGFLYLAGRDEQLHRGDPDIRVVITNGRRQRKVITRVPVVYTTATQTARFVNRLEISRYLSKGTNQIAISGWDYDFPEGAFAYAVYRGGARTPQKMIQVRDGADVGWFPVRPPFGPDSEVVSFRFAPSAVARKARVVMAIADAEADRGDEVFGFTGKGLPSSQLRDTDGDGLIDIINRLAPLTMVDNPPRGIDPANASGALEADRRAFSLEEDCLGVPRTAGGCGIGPEFNVVDRQYRIPAGHAHANFQVQSEDPENGDSFMLLFALNEVTLEDAPNPVPDIQVVKNVTPTVLPEPGGPATFEVIVTNPAWSEESLRLGSLVDDVFGDVTVVQGRISESTCAVPQVILKGASYRCTFVATVSGTIRQQHRDIVTASGSGVISGAPVSDRDDAVVTFTRPDLGSIGDRVWLDDDRDGVQDAGETGINGVTVILRDAATKTEIARTTTASSAGNVEGFYSFTNLVAGAYTVEVVPPAGMRQTYDLDGLATPHVASRTLATGEHAQDVDFGYDPPGPNFTVTKTASIEEGYPGEKVTYTFVVTNNGEITLETIVVVDNKLGYIGTVPRLDPNQSATLYKQDYPLPVCDDSGFTSRMLCAGTTGSQAICSLPNTVTATWQNIARTAEDCVNILPQSIGDRVWLDGDRDGVQDGSETGINGVTVILRDAVTKTEIARTTTASSAGNVEGFYSFTNLVAGAYTVEVVPPAGMRQTYDLDGLATPHAADRTLAVGEHAQDVDFGYDPLEPNFTVTKKASIDEGRPGEKVTYTFVVTNNGEVTLETIVVVDNKLGYIGTVPRLDPNQSATLYKEDYPLPVCDDSGFTSRTLCEGTAGSTATCSLPNTVTATWQNTVRTAQDCVNILMAPKIAVTKVADPTFGYIFPAEAWPGTSLPRKLDVAYTVEVTNPGTDEALENVTVTDNPATLVFTYRSGDTDGDGLLDLTEKWVYTAAWSYHATGVYPDTVTARGIGAVSGIEVAATADASVEVVSCGTCEGKVNKLSLRWNGSAAAKISVVIENNKFPNPQVFSGMVQPGGVFEFEGPSSSIGGFDGTLGTNISLYEEIDGDDVFRATIHTSCSQPIYPGQDWGTNGAIEPPGSGPFTVVKVSSLHGGEICPLLEK